MEDQPIPDMVEVVRCQECRWCEDTRPSVLYCNHPDNRNPLGCLPDDYCNDGEREERGRTTDNR